MNVLNVLNFLSICWLRGFYFGWISYNLLKTAYFDKAWIFLVLGSLIIGIFSFFNVFVVLIPFYVKTDKFLRIKIN